MRNYLGFLFGTIRFRVVFLVLVVRSRLVHISIEYLVYPGNSLILAFNQVSQTISYVTYYFGGEERGKEAKSCKLSFPVIASWKILVVAFN